MSATEELFARSERTRVVEHSGPGFLELQQLVQQLVGKGANVLMVTTPGLVQARWAGVAEQVLRGCGGRVEVLDDVQENPTTDDVNRGVALARSFHPDVLVGFGGGSAIDVAKGINLVHCCGGRMQDFWGSNKATAPLLPMIAVPTTAGTGSEVQSYALIADAETHRKMACGDPAAAPRFAFLYPELTTTMPRHVTAITGLDAIGHAVETCVTNARTELSAAFALRAFALLAPAFGRVLEDGEDLAARADMLRGAALAGLAIEHSMLGAAHALANPLTQHHDVVHGQAVATMLPGVVRFNAEDAVSRERYAALARAATLSS